MQVLQAVLHWLGFGLCHQLPERSFFGGGVQAPVCARDTGIYIGTIVSIWLISLLHRGERPREFPTTPGWIAIVLMIGAMGWDGVSSYAGWRTTTNDLRLLTGLLAGFAIGALLTPMLNDQLWLRSSRQRVLDPPWRLVVWLAMVPVSFVLIWYGGPMLGVVYPALIGLAVVTALTVVNLVMVCLLPWFERRAERLIDAWLPIAIALGLTFFEVWLAGMFRYGLIALVSRLG